MRAVDTAAGGNPLSACASRFGTEDRRAGSYKEPRLTVELCLSLGRKTRSCLEGLVTRTGTLDSQAPVPCVSRLVTETATTGLMERLTEAEATVKAFKSQALPKGPGVIGRLV